MPPIPWTVSVRDHPGSSADDIAKEPDWDAGHEHRIGFKNKQDRVPGITHQHDDYDEEIEEACQDFRVWIMQAEKGKLINFRDVMKNQKDLHLRMNENRSIGWRYVLQASEDWIKNTQDWPANVKKRQQQQEQKKDDKNKGNQQEHEWKRAQGENKHHSAYAGVEDSGYDSGIEQSGQAGNLESDQDKLHKKYTLQEITLLRNLRHEKEYISQLKTNDGKGRSPQHQNRTQISIDEKDQFTPDNWLPRSSDLIRLTGKHPLNAEAHLSHLFDAGLITPNELHYVRNHGAVPCLLWEFHKLEIQSGKLTLSMDELKNKYATINIPVTLACDGNRRKELNMIKKSKGFNWGAGAVGCAYWKGPLLRDVLLSTGIPETMPGGDGKRHWVHFEGADEPSDGKYATSIPFEHAMDPANDVILAYEMNDVPLPPDHGYPVRLIVPGYVGGRCVKWLKKIWISDKENDSYYHIWDNRVLPSFVTEKDGEFADALFHHPDTACNEQNLNSVIVKPAQGEKISLAKARKGHSYRIAGFAYYGGGHQVQRVEVSLDDGETWLYCMRQFPDFPIRHGKKFWTWLHWHVDVELSHLLRAKSIMVRCFNAFKNTQPEKPSWNVMGMMNNSWYVVRPSIVDAEDSDIPSILFQHPVEPGTGEGGWMKPSTENQIENARQEAGVPQKQFTRKEIEKHDKEDDCWIVIDGKVYDATSVLAGHPGGKAAVLGHAGKVHQETSDEFASIHDGYAYQKLKECVLGVVTEKAANFIKKNAEAAAKEKASSQDSDDQLVLQKHRWVPVRLVGREEISHDTRIYTFALPEGKPVLGLGTCQHVQIGFHLKDRMLIRSYTPTRPLLPAPKHHNHNSVEHEHEHALSPASTTFPQSARRDSKASVSAAHHALRDGDGTFDLTVKTYFPDEQQPGGALSNILDLLPLESNVEIRGPTGAITYHGCGAFAIDGRPRHFSRISLVLGGSGLTPGYALIARILLSADPVRVRCVYANRSEGDILLKDELDRFVEEGRGQVSVTHVLSRAGDSWEGERGHVSAELLKRSLFEPGEESVVFLCGPKGMVEGVGVPALKEWGYKEDENMFGF